MRRILPTSAVRGSRNRPPRRLPTASVAAFALLALGACAGESTMPPSGGDAQQQQQQQYDTGAIPTYDSYVFPDTGGGGQEDAGTSTFADTGSGQQDAGAYGSVTTGHRRSACLAWTGSGASRRRR